MIFGRETSSLAVKADFRHPRPDVMLYYTLICITWMTVVFSSTTAILMIIDARYHAKKNDFNGFPVVNWY